MTTGVKQEAKSFTQLHSYKKLEHLAQKPVDLTNPKILTPQRIDKYVADACGYRMLYGTERVDDAVMEALFSLADEAHVHEKMEQMQAGDVVNIIHGYPSEQRSVLHTATRDLFDHPNTSHAATEARKFCKREIDKLKSFCHVLDVTKKFNDLVAIGIGGSDLGPRAHYIALEHLLKPGRRVHFISNIDPDDAARTLRGLDLAKTCVVVVSKTGTTLETRSNEEFVRQRFVDAGLKPQRHFISVSMEGSPMDDPTRYLECFYIGDWVGGRYSTTSMVGGVSLGFAFGFDVFMEFLHGAHSMDLAALSREKEENLPLLGALLAVWNRTFLHCPTLALIPYSQALARYPAHIQQVEMESNGKHIDKEGRFVDFSTGAVIWGEPGTNAQHSFYQLIHQGTDTIPVEFIGYAESQCGQDNTFKGTTLQEKLLSNLFAQALALATGQKGDNPNKDFRGNRPSHILLGKKLTPAALGSLLAYFEHKVAFEGFMWGINSFDQEGVQLGKVLADRLIALFADPKRAVEYPLGEAFLKQLHKIEK